MKKNKLFRAIFGLILVSVPLFCATTVIKSARNEKSEIAGYTKDSTELNRIVDVINIIETRYVGKEETPNKDELYKGAVAGVISKLNDPYSEYLSKEDLTNFSEDMDGEYVGVGMTINKKKGEALEVVSPFIGSPAEKVGIKIGDKITKVDDKDILPLTAADTVKLLKGKEGTKVNVEVIRSGKKEPLKFTMTRAKIKLEMVESKMLDNNIGYLSLLRFGNHVGEEVQKAIEDLQNKGMKGLILDLRLNPGGSLQEAQDISSLSASEIVTGAIKDYKRGTIIGEKTFGKGIVQQIIPLKTDDAIKLTIAQYFTPKGNYIHEKGIEPDIKVEMEELLALKGYANDSAEARKNREKEVEEILVKDKGAEEAKKIIAAGDVQLKRAIEEMNKKLKTVKK